MLGLIMDIWNFKIIDYVVKEGVNFQKILGKKGILVFEKVKHNEYIYMCVCVCVCAYT